MAIYANEDGTIKTLADNVNIYDLQKFTESTSLTMSGPPKLVIFSWTGFEGNSYNRISLEPNDSFGSWYNSTTKTYKYVYSYEYDTSTSVLTITIENNSRYSLTEGYFIIVY